MIFILKANLFKVLVYFINDVAVLNITINANNKFDAMFKMHSKFINNYRIKVKNATSFGALRRLIEKERHFNYLLSYEFSSQFVP